MGESLFAGKMFEACDAMDDTAPACSFVATPRTVKKKDEDNGRVLSGTSILSILIVLKYSKRAILS